VALLSRVVQSRSRILSIKTAQNSAVSTLEKLDDRTANLNERLREVEQKLHAANKAVKEIDFADVQENERARDQLDRKVRQSNQTIGRLKQTIKAKQAEVESKKRELNLKSQENVKSRFVAHHMNVAAQARTALTAAATAYETEARAAISHKVDKILEKVLRKDYTFQIDDDFSIKLMSGDNVVGSSSGESQLLGLLFTAALCEYSRDRLEDKTAFLTPGTVAPMVLDSPLGQLDDTYKLNTAEFLPTMADQVILLLSSSQGDAETVNTLRPHVGKEYLLQAHNTGAKGSRGVESKNIGGKDYALTLYDATEATTKVVEVPL
jgi:DNA sulfur modification protein DndD